MGWAFVLKKERKEIKEGGEEEKERKERKIDRKKGRKMDWAWLWKWVLCECVKTGVRSGVSTPTHPSFFPSLSNLGFASWTTATTP